MAPGVELLQYKRKIVRRLQHGKTIVNIAPIEIIMLPKRVVLIGAHNYEYKAKLIAAMFLLTSQ